MAFISSVQFPIALLCSALLVSCQQNDKATTENPETTQPAESAASAEQAEGNQADKPLPTTISFNEHIRPIFSDTCFACHGFDPKHREADLRLDTEEGAFAVLKEAKNGQRAIVPGKPEESEVWKRLVTHDSEKIMPPVDFHKPISDYQKALIKRWIEQGAKYEKHWAYTPIVKPELPTLTKHARRVVNPIDSFVLKRLEDQGIEPSEPAEKTSLIRRLTLDLTGLPPSPEEVKAFTEDSSPNAYEKLVDRLMASSRFGERMAVPWLDVVRFADTVGFHGDQNQWIFPYRDYVINSINRDQPFNDFVKEQIAGDLLKDPTDEQLIATGFIRLSMMTREGGAQPNEYLAKYTADRVRAVGAAFLGQTTGCAECHDHKFDPITAKDFYSLGAFFSDVQQWGVYGNTGNIATEARILNNDSPFPPALELPSQSLLDRIADLRFQAFSENASRAKVTPEWEQETLQHLKKYPDGWATPTVAAVVASKNTPHQIKPDQSIVFNGAQQAGETITVTYDLEPGLVSGFRVEVLPDPSNQNNIGRGAGGTFAMGQPSFQWLGADGKEIGAAQAIPWSQADHQLPYGFSNGHASVRLANPWRMGAGDFNKPEITKLVKTPHTAVHLTPAPIQVNPGMKLRVLIPSDSVGRIRISTTRFAEPVAGQPAVSNSVASALNTPTEKRSADQQILIQGTWALSQLPAAQLNPNWPILANEIRKCNSGITRSLIAVRLPDNKIPVSRLLPRGDWQNQSGEIVEPGVLSFLPQPEAAGKRKLNRLDLADWIVSDSNPLTARHQMNRTWKQFFGSGISNVLDDLGSQGEWPSHPDLLDWLAHEFRASGWSRKHMVKLMVMSSTYRQKAAIRKDLKDIDPYNRLLAQQSARRLDAEFIRDNSLAISGLLSTGYVGGPSVFPYQPPGYYSAIQFPDRDYHTSLDNQRYRRGVYMHWQRTFLHPMLANFDAPSREECAADRLQANSPLQALTQLNDQNAVETARAFASLIIKQSPAGTQEDRIKLAYQRALSRDPSAEELASLTRFLDEQIKHYKAVPKDANLLKQTTVVPATMPIHEFSAWIQVSRAILNLHETITRY